MLERTEQLHVTYRDISLGIFAPTIRYHEGVFYGNGWYYLLIAEGGTEHFHAVTVGRSRSLTEPFENYAGNPILTHRHLGREYPICNVGHADMTELPDGSWYMVCLGSRLVEGYHKPLGRETFRAVRVEYRLLKGDIQHFEETLCGSVDVPRAADYVLRMRADGLRYAFAVAAGDAEYTVAEDVDASHLGSETAGGFVGAYLGMFASGGGTEYEDEAAFDYVTFRCVRSSRRARVV